MRNASRASFLRVSLRELFFTFGFLAVTCAALKYANQVWWNVLAVSSLLMFVGAVVTATIDRGRRQSLALGFALGAAISGAMIWIAPTTAPPRGMLQRLWETIVVDTTTETVSEAVPSAKVDDLFGPPPATYPNNPYGAVSVSIVRSPEWEPFMKVGHLLWAMAIGFLGGRFAGWINDRRTQRDLAPGAANVEQ
jgi:hypothetical protein